MTADARVWDVAASNVAAPGRWTARGLAPRPLKALGTYTLTWLYPSAVLGGTLRASLLDGCVNICRPAFITMMPCSLR
jgi:hypothetical protein